MCGNKMTAGLEAVAETRGLIRVAMIGGSIATDPSEGRDIACFLLALLQAS